MSRPQKAQAARAFPGLDKALIDGFYENVGYATPLGLVAHLQDLCRQLAPAVVVEVGSGLSTAALVAALPGESTLISVDENVEWLARAARGVTRPRTAYIAAPGESGLDFEALRALLGDLRPGILLVDGPSNHPRFSPPALRLYERIVTANCVVAVDDTDRAENDSACVELAARAELRKVDYGDPVYTNHRYSLLLPADVEPPAAFAEPPL